MEKDEQNMLRFLKLYKWSDMFFLLLPVLGPIHDTAYNFAHLNIASMYDVKSPIPAISI